MRIHSTQMYLLDQPASEHQILEEASMIIEQRHIREGIYENPDATKEFLSFKLHNLLPNPSPSYTRYIPHP